MGRDDDIIINGCNISEISGRVDSFINDITDYLSNEFSVLNFKTDDTSMNLSNLQDELESNYFNENDSYNLYSPVDNNILNQKKHLKSKISLCELQLNEYKEDLERSNLNLQHLSEVKDYILKLENIITQKYKSNTNMNAYSVKNNEGKHEFDKGLQILKTQELERKRIARDLHDSTVQNLTSLIHKTELCSKYVDIDGIRTKLELEIMKKTIRSTINDMREIIFDLRPMSLDDLGLIPTVERYTEQIMQNNDIKIHFTYMNDINNVYSIINTTLFRIIQEACNNVLKHAKASNIKINLTYNDSGINLYVEDDGIGFEVTDQIEETCVTNSSFGLSIMKERVYLLSGQIHIESKANQGTQIFISVPVNSYMEEKE